MLCALGFPLLLAACRTSSTPTGPDDTSDRLPYVPRVVATTFNCSAGGTAGGLAGLVGGGQQDRGNLIGPRISAQTDLPDTVQDMLYASKSLLNNVYFGYSTVDLQALHDAAYTSFKKVYPNHLGTYYVGDATDPLMDSYIDGVNDHHTFYLDQAAYANFKSTSGNTPQSVATFGIRTQPVPGQDGVLILNVRAEGSAFAAGLRRGDVLLSVDGVALTRSVAATDGDDSAQSDAYAKILAAAAARQTPVSVVVRRGTAQRTVSLSGAVLGGTEFPWGELRNDAAGHKFFYLRIPTFSGNGIGAKVHELVAQANTQGASGLVVDLRNNGGGLLREYVGAVAAFVPDKAGQQVKYVDASASTFSYNNGSVLFNSSCQTPTPTLKIPAPALWSGKVAVLLNSGSASASEMFSQNIKLGGKATLIGEATYGVGNTSTFVFELPATRGLSITAGRVSVGGVEASEKVTPEVNVPDDRASLAATGSDAALQSAYTELLK